MVYVKKTLAHDEQYLYRAKFNWTYDCVSWFWLILGAAPFSVWLYVQTGDRSEVGLGEWYVAAAVTGLVVAVLIWLTRYVHKWTTVIAVTTARVIFKRGLISRRSNEINLNKIEEVVVHQTFFGRVLGYGTLTIRGTGAAMIELPPIGRPLFLRREIEQASSSAGNRFE